MIELQQLSKRYQSTNGAIAALSDININVKAGEIFGIIGKSGAGKSTLIRCINLLEQASSGKMLIDGVDMTQLSGRELRRARSQIGMIFQHFNLMSSKTVFQNIALPLRLQQLDAKEVEQRIAPLLELVGLTDKRDSYPSQLSGGQKQRVAIARALASKPKLLLCDEATSALDPSTTQSILELLSDINAKLDLTIMIITHEMDVIKSICDRVAVLDQGLLVEQATVIDLFSRPQSTVAQQLIEKTRRHQLPQQIMARLKTKADKNSHPIVRISFVGQPTQKPIIAHLIKEMDLDINILQADIEPLHHDVIGNMTVEFCGQAQRIQQAYDYLDANSIKHEVIAYVD